MLGYSHLISKDGCLCFKCIRERAEKHKASIASTLIVIKDYQMYAYSEEVAQLIQYLEKIATEA